MTSAAWRDRSVYNERSISHCDLGSNPVAIRRTLRSESDATHYSKDISDEFLKQAGTLQRRKDTAD
jgi:hypothetical protein